MTNLDLTYGCDPYALVECQNCTWSGRALECNPIVDAEQRLTAGDPTPAGECPSCGCLAVLSEVVTPPTPGDTYEVVFVVDIDITHKCKVTIADAQTSYEAEQQAWSWLHKNKGGMSDLFIKIPEDDNTPKFEDVYISSADRVEDD